MQWFRNAQNILPAVKGERSLLDGLRQVQEFLVKNKIGEDCVEQVSQWKKGLDSKYDEQSRIEKDDAVKLSRDADNWSEITLEFLKNKHILETELQSGLNPNELSKLANKEPSEFIVEEVWKRLTDIEKSDFSDAARCLLLGTATPSVMVALRGAEASIRNYYHHKTKEEPEKKTWRQLTHELKNKAVDLKIADAFIGYLDYYGEAKRNFAQHPKKIYSLREAVVIFMQVIGLIGDIYGQIEAHTEEE